MKARGILMVAVLAGSGCSRPAAPPAAGEEAEPRTETATLWTERTELYLERPVLVKGRDSRFAIHLTRLSDFKPVREGKCEVELAYAGGGKESFFSAAPSSPGIFGATVRPGYAGAARITLRLTGPLSDVHHVGAIEVYASQEQVPPGEAGPAQEVVKFLKEQQWSLDFGTAVARPAAVQASLRVAAEVTPRSGGEAQVTAPLGGRLVAEGMPAVGVRVERGQVLGAILPPTSAPSDLAALEGERAEAAAALAQARRDEERASRVVQAGAAPARRLEEARTTAEIARARLEAVERRIAQHGASRQAESAEGAPAFALRAPIGGVVAATHGSPGANLQAGETVVRIVDTDLVYVTAIVPESELPRLRSLRGAELEIPGLERPRPARRLVTVGKIIDPASRTLPVVYEVDNRDGRVAIHQTLWMRLFLSGTRQALVAPEAAVVDDGGRPVMFIQKDGESFERRPVRTGLAQSGGVEILEGLHDGERFVARGAYLIRLAALSSQIPAHGHVH